MSRVAYTRRANEQASKRVATRELPLLTTPLAYVIPCTDFLNEYDQTGLEHVPAYIQPDGKVTIEHNMRSTFLCSTTKPIRSFPFDSYKCYAELAIDHPEKRKFSRTHTHARAHPFIAFILTNTLTL